MQNLHINIKEFLPHCKPMLMADEILDISEKNVVTSFHIDEKNIFVNNGVLEESGMTENIAQTCSAIFGQKFFDSENNERKKVVGYISNIKTLKIYQKPKVGETIIGKAELISKYNNNCSVSCKTFSNEKLLAEAEISLIIKEIED